jgi:hypothetical protein
MRSFTLDEWCERRRISRSMFYKLKSKGRGPQTHYAGVKCLISDEADAAWVKQCEAENAQTETSA